MTKAELISRIVDAMVDPWTDNPEDYLDSEPVDIEYAKVMLKDLRDNEDAADLEQDERLPDCVTPEIVMEAYNCLIRAKKFEARTQRLAEWIRENDPVCEYANYYVPEHDDAYDLFPIDFLDDNDGYHFTDDATPLEILQIGINSKDTFNPNHEYCWYDKEKNQLFSCDEPFCEGVLDAEAFARFILLDAETFGYMFDNIIDDEDATYILGCTKEEYINE